MDKQPLTAREMGLKSWEARKAKYGENKALAILNDASEKGAKARRLDKNKKPNV